MAHQSQLVAIGNSSAVLFAGASVVAVTLGPDSLCDACEINGQTLTEGGIVYLPSPSDTVAVRRARDRFHAEGSPGALVSLVGWTAGEAPTPVRRTRWRYTAAAPKSMAGPPLYDATPFLRAPVYGRRNVRIGLQSSAAGTIYVMALFVSYAPGGAGSIGRAQVVDIEQVSAPFFDKGASGLSDPDIADADYFARLVSGAPEACVIRRGCGDKPAVSADEVWLYSGGDAGYCHVEAW